MSGAIPLLPLHAFTAWTGIASPLLPQILPVPLPMQHAWLEQLWTTEARQATFDRGIYHKKTYTFGREWC